MSTKTAIPKEAFRNRHYCPSCSYHGRRGIASSIILSSSPSSLLTPSKIKSSEDVGEDEKVSDTIEDVENRSSPVKSLLLFDSIHDRDDGTVLEDEVLKQQLLLEDDWNNRKIGEESSDFATIEKVESASKSSFLDGILSSYLGPRIILALAALVYGTNFPLGSLMDDALPASAATSARMVVAALVLSPYLFKIPRHLAGPILLCGCFTCLGYITQSLALIDTPPAVVSFLGATVVLICPFLEWFVDGKPMGIRDAPQTWLASFLCIAGVGVLELLDPIAMGQPDGSTIAAAVATSSVGAPALSDLTATPLFDSFLGIDSAGLLGLVLGIVQAAGFGTQVFLTGKMRSGISKDGGGAEEGQGQKIEEENMALPITAGLLATTAFLSMIWSFVDGWIATPGGDAYTLPHILSSLTMLDPSCPNPDQMVALAVLWTGIVSTSLIFVVEVTALGRVPVAEAAVILATEPLWAAFLSSLMTQSGIDLNVVVGGMLILGACLANTLQISHFQRIFGDIPEEKGNKREFDSQMR